MENKDKDKKKIEDEDEEKSLERLSKKKYERKFPSIMASPQGV
jgi:hypothetical protein